MSFSFEEKVAGLYLIKKSYSVERAGHGSDISGPYWMLVEIELRRGRIWWISDGREVIPSVNRVFVFLPPFSWAMEHCGKGTELGVKGLISKSKLRAQAFMGPILFTSDEALPETIDGVEKLLNRVASFENIGVSTNPSSLSLRAKRILDGEYESKIEIQEIAARLKTSSAVLARTFKSDFGQTPAFYRKGLRVTVGMYELMMGVPPIRAAGLAGFSDLGRFYKQFKAYLKQTPSEYSTKSKNAKI